MLLICPVVAISSSLHIFLTCPHYSLSTSFLSGQVVPSSSCRFPPQSWNRTFSIEALNPLRGEWHRETWIWTPVAVGVHIASGCHCSRAPSVNSRDSVCQQKCTHTRTRWFNTKYDEHCEFLPLLLIPVKSHRDRPTGFFFIFVTPFCDSKLAPIVCVLLV